MCLGVPGRVVAIADAERLHVVADVRGTRREISAAVTGIRTPEGEVLGDADPADAVGVGDWVEVHLGFAMGRMDEDEAREVLDGLRELEQAYEDAYERELGRTSKAYPTDDAPSGIETPVAEE
jgi:hydrogenase expression/formation protein HypC